MSNAKSRNREKLIKESRSGGITLVLGAGVSMSRGVPSWGSLVADIWRQTRKVPTDIGADAPRPPAWLEVDDREWALRQKAKELLEATPGFGTDFTSRFDIVKVPPHPLAFQILLEEIEYLLRPKRRESEDAIGEAHAELVRLLREGLYRDLIPKGSNSLSTLIEVVRTDQKRDQQRIRRVISFNADDLLEQGANEGHSPGEDPVVWPISRASFHPRGDGGANNRPPISIYHVHGYLPQTTKRRARRGAPDTLVFTDAQYWESVANPTSFANRIVRFALHDTHCVFIGLSMTDMNLMRWLGGRYVEIQEDKLSEVQTEARALRDDDPKQKRLKVKTLQNAPDRFARALNKHYWVRTRQSDPTGLITRHLERRGVTSVEIADWTTDFDGLMRDCFLAPGPP